MGACSCKCMEGDNFDPYVSASQRNTPRGSLTSPAISQQLVRGFSTYDPKSVEEMVREALRNILISLETPGTYPPAILRMHAIAEKDEGWIQVLTALIHVVPLDIPFGPSMITILLEDCPLPTRETVLWVTQLFNLSAQRAELGENNISVERNILVVLGFLATKLAGPSSVAVLTSYTLDYLLMYLKSHKDANMVLFALLTLEKFAQTTENQLTIKMRLEQEQQNPLLQLESYTCHSDLVWRQVGFCAKWSLDNVFTVPGRKFSYETVDMSEVNVMLNTKDVSEYLKISPDGLEARSDCYLFESVRCTYQVDSGCWYYETLIVTPGVMQIGWATKNSHFLNHDGYGIGDDLFSLSYDGCRRLIWHEARAEHVDLPRWCPGDILGCLLDITQKEIIFSINGKRLSPCKKIFATVRQGFFAAASFMTFQQCRFNFGREPFHHPPTDREFQCFNKHGLLTAEDKKVLPRHIKLDKLRNFKVEEDSCTLCFDRVASCSLKPCGHSGFCSLCTSYLGDCPLCRSPILDVWDELARKGPDPGRPASEEKTSNVTPSDAQPDVKK